MVMKLLKLHQRSSKIELTILEDFQSLRKKLNRTLRSQQNPNMMQVQSLQSKYII